MSSIKAKRRKKAGAGQYILSAILLLYTIFCAMPILLVFIGAVTDEKTLATEGFSYFPSKFSLDGVSSVLKYGKQLFVSYGVTIFVTVAGTALGLFVMSMLAYSLSRRDFRMRSFLSIYILIPMLFSGGQLSSYIIYTSTYHLKDNLLLLILPLCVSTMNIIILRTYVQSSIPEELIDSARIDGAGEYRTFFQIVFPLMKPAMAAVGFMMATAFWNDWQNALLFITSDNKKPLQLLLVNIQKSIETLLSNKNIPTAVLAKMQGVVPQNSATMATVIVAVSYTHLTLPTTVTV